MLLESPPVDRQVVQLCIGAERPFERLVSASIFGSNFRWLHIHRVKVKLELAQLYESRVRNVTTLRQTGAARLECAPCEHPKNAPITPCNTTIFLRSQPGVQKTYGPPRLQMVSSVPLAVCIPTPVLVK